MMRLFTVFICLLVLFNRSTAQPVFCPNNLDFEQGVLSDWQFYTGSCCPINTPTLSGPLANRHDLTNGAATDPYGGFPVVAPAGGNYSLKLGNDGSGSEAEKARYYVRIPANLNNYGLIYRYAVVFEDPNHTTAQQPRFEVNVYDSATGDPINCNQFTYVAGSSLPGFLVSPIDPQVYYKDWTTGSLDFTGMAGRTIIVDFATGDCSLGAHFGYGYIDMTCGLFAISSSACSSNPTTSLTGPFGFQTYEWWDAGFTTLIGTGQTVIIPTPPNNTGFNVVLTPYPGFGCPDTLFTTVTVSNMTIDLVNNDTTLCNGAGVQLNTLVNTSFPPATFSWAPTQGLSCTNCPNPIASPNKNTQYVVTVVDAVGCTQMDTVQVNVSPNIEKTVQNVSCFGAADGSISLNVTGFAPFIYSWNTVPPQNTSSISNLGPGSYAVTVTDNQSCVNHDTITITQPVPFNVTTNPPQYSCTGADITAVASGGTPPYSYSWNTVPVQNTATVVGVGSGTYTVTATDANGCTSQASVTITLSSVPLSAVASNIGFAGCSGPPTGSATVTASGGTAPYSYSWNTVPPRFTPSVSGLPAGTYTVSITDAQNCVKQLPVTIPASDLDVTVNSFTNVNCLGGSDGTATATATGGTPGYTYSWNTVPPQNTPTATNLTPGTYSVIVTDGDNCKDTNSVTITEPATRLATTMVVNDVACFNTSTGSATIVANGGTPPYTYSWNTVPPQNTATATNLAIGTYTATVTDANGCTSTKSATIDQPTDLIASITGTTNVSCFGGNDGTATAAGSGGTPPYTFSWNTTPVQNTATATSLPAGTHTATVTDAKGCTKTTSITITQPAMALVSAITSKKDVGCMGSSDGSATVTASGGTPPYSYSWNTSPAQITATAFYLSYGIYDVIVTDSKGCTSLSSVSIGQPTLLQVSAVVLQNTCPGRSDGAIEATASGGTPPYTYQWNTVPVQNTAVVNNLPAGTYTVTITDANSCVTYATVAVNDFELSVSAGNDTTICRGDQALLQGTGSTVYNWAPVDKVDCANCQNTFAYPDTTTLFTLYGVDAFHNCPDTAEILVTVLQKNGGSVGPTVKLCEGDTARLFASGGGTYSWSPVAGLDSSWLPNPLVHPEKDTKYQVVITENACFKDTLYQQVEVYPQPTLDLGPDIRTLAGEPVNLNASITNATKITWTPADGLSCSNCQQPVATLQSTTTYIVEAETNIGCKAVDSITIYVGCDGSAFFIPNTFSPNGDGENDRFYPRGADVKSVNYFRIYDRWGEKVFEATNIPTNDPMYGWDGTFRGRTVDPAVFVYILEMNCANGDPVVVKGDVSVVR